MRGRRKDSPFQQDRTAIDPEQNLPWWIPVYVIREIREERGQHEN